MRPGVKMENKQVVVLRSVDPAESSQFGDHLDPRMSHILQANGFHHIDGTARRLA